MKRQGHYRPTVEDALELSGIETLHPGGEALTRRTAELAGLCPGMHILDVSSGRGTQAIFYAAHFGVMVTGVDISPAMVAAAKARADRAGLASQTRFLEADSQLLPFPDHSFDAVINECAVGIPDDSQQVLNEMVRVVKPGAPIVIHESIWRRPVPPQEKDELAERYGTTPLEAEEWIAMLQAAGVGEITSELEPWSRPEQFWNIRQGRRVRHYRAVLTPGEMVRTTLRVLRAYGLRGVRTTFENRERFFRAVLDGRLGYGLFQGVAHHRSTSAR